MTNEKELLRITDEETGYDLVAVQNPHGDFGISTFAENEDGRKPVDGKYMLSKIIRRIGNGGGFEVTTLYGATGKTPDDYDFLVFSQGDRGIDFDPDDTRIVSSDDIENLLNSGIFMISDNDGIWAVDGVTTKTAEEGLIIHLPSFVESYGVPEFFVTRDFVKQGK